MTTGIASFTPPAMLTGLEGSPGLQCNGSSRLYLVTSPQQDLFQRDRSLIDVIEPGLADIQLECFNIIEVTEILKDIQRITGRRI